MRNKKSVLKDWMVENCSWKEQTVLLCALRGADSNGSAEVKALTRFIRSTVLENAAPKKTFMQKEKQIIIHDLEKTPLVLDMLPVHFFGHLLHAFQVIAFRHPNKTISEYAFKTYLSLCEYLHVEYEGSGDMTKRLADEV